MRNSDRSLKVVAATRRDLQCILDWLRDEYEWYGESFWTNENLIRNYFINGELWVVREAGQAVAFHAGRYNDPIVCVRREMQRRGYGTALANAWIKGARRDGVNVLAGECMPQSSLPFWQKFGFTVYPDPDGEGRILVRLIIERDLDVPADLPRTDVTVGVYPEAAAYKRDVEPIAVHRLRGAMQDDGTVLLERRTVVAGQDEPDHKDPVVKIEAGGIERCFCKAKHLAAQQAGVQRDPFGAFFIDAVPPGADQPEDRARRPDRSSGGPASWAGSAAADT